MLAREPLPVQRLIGSDAGATEVVLDCLPDLEGKVLSKPLSKSGQIVFFRLLQAPNPTVETLRLRGMTLHRDGFLELHRVIAR